MRGLVAPGRGEDSRQPIVIHWPVRVYLLDIGNREMEAHFFMTMGRKILAFTT